MGAEVMELKLNLKKAKEAIKTMEDLKLYLDTTKDTDLSQVYHFCVLTDGVRLDKKSERCIVCGFENEKYFSYYLDNQCKMGFTEYSEFNGLLDYVFMMLVKIVSTYKKNIRDRVFLITKGKDFAYYTFDGKEFLTDWKHYKSIYKLQDEVYRNAILDDVGVRQKIESECKLVEKIEFSKDEEQQLIAGFNLTEELLKYIKFKDGLWQLRVNKKIPDVYGYSIHSINFMMLYQWGYLKKEFYRIQVEPDYQYAYVIYEGNAYYVQFNPEEEIFSGQKFINNMVFEDIEFGNYYYPYEYQTEQYKAYYMKTIYFQNGFITDRICDAIAKFKELRHINNKSYIDINYVQDDELVHLSYEDTQDGLVNIPENVWSVLYQDDAYQYIETYEQEQKIETRVKFTTADELIKYLGEEVLYYQYEILNYWGCKIIYEKGDYYNIDKQGNASVISHTRVYEIERTYAEAQENANEEHSGYGSTIWNTGMQINPEEAFGDTYMIPEKIGDYPINYIYERAFAGCSSLNKVVINKNIKQIGKEAFMETGVYADSTNWVNNALYIDNWLIKVDVSYEGIFEVQNNTVGIADAAFESCTKITEVYIPDTVKYLGDELFNECSELLYVKLPIYVSRFGNNIFIKHDKLKCIDIPAFINPDEIDTDAQKNTINWDNERFAYGSYSSKYDLKKEILKSRKLIENILDFAEYINMFNTPDSVIKYFYSGCVHIYKNESYVCGHDENGYFNYYCSNYKKTEFTRFDNEIEFINYVFDTIAKKITLFKQTEEKHVKLLAQKNDFLYFVYKGHEYVSEYQGYIGEYRLFRVDNRNIISMYDIGTAIKENEFGMIYNEKTWPDLKRYLENILGGDAKIQIKVNRESVCMGDDVQDHTQIYELDEDATYEDLFYELKRDNYFPSVYGNNVVWILTLQEYPCIFSYYTLFNKFIKGLSVKELKVICRESNEFYLRYYSSPQKWKCKIYSLYNGDVYTMWHDGWGEEIEYCNKLIEIGITVDEVIKIYIQYKGCRQGLFTDYGAVFDEYLEYYMNELKDCSLFEQADKENSLAIRYRENQFVIYYTDERAALHGIEYKFDNTEEAIKKYLELFHMCDQLQYK